MQHDPQERLHSDQFSSRLCTATPSERAGEGLHRPAGVLFQQAWGSCVALQSSNSEATP